MEHNAFFLPRKRKTIVIGKRQSAAVPALRHCRAQCIRNGRGAGEKTCLLHQHAHQHGYPVKEASHPGNGSPAGYTVGTGNRGVGAHHQRLDQQRDCGQDEHQPDYRHHTQKNITEKLGIKSVSGLTIYAVMNGYVEADRI